MISISTNLALIYDSSTVRYIIISTIIIYYTIMLFIIKEYSYFAIILTLRDMLSLVCYYKALCVL